MAKKITKILSLLMVCALSAVLLAGCGQDDSELPDMSSMGTITAVAREDGSGTRDVFEDLVDTDEAGADATALSTEEVEALVAEDACAIGYIAYSSVSEDTNVNILSVNGIEPEESTIKSGKYPLCRNYYIAYSGDLGDLGEDFLRFVETKGQEIVSEYAIAVDESSTFLSDKSSGTLTIEGSSSVAPLMEALIEEYVKYNPNGEIIVETTNSTEGLTEAMRGNCDLAMSSRDLKDYEEELLETTVIAKDAISVIVNVESPLTNLTLDQIKDIYDGAVEEWNELS